jgi:hypothetical protein
VRLGSLALIGPQPGEAHGRAQLKGSRLLPPGDVEGLAEGGLGRRPFLRRLRQQKLASQAMDLRLTIAFVALLGERRGFAQGAEPLSGRLCPGQGFGQQDQAMRVLELRARRSIRIEPLANPLCSTRMLSLPSQRCALQDRCGRQCER